MKSNDLAGSQYLRTPLAPEALPKNPVRSAGVTTTPQTPAWKAVPRIILALVLVLLCLTMCSCGSSKQLTVVDRVTHDTLYINKIQYDSIYQNDSFLMDYHPSKEYVYLFDSVLVMKVDTMYIRDKQVQYKYKYLRDTTYFHHVDTIPVIQQVEVVKEVKKPLSWFDRLCRYSFFMLLGAVLIWFLSKSKDIIRIR